MNQPPSQPNPAFCPAGSATTVAGSTIPQGRSSTPMHENVVPMDTPNSAPSPLDEPQPPPSSSMDPTMPTLSPHPPSKFMTDLNGGRSAGGVVANIGGGGTPSDLAHIATAGVSAEGTSVVASSNGSNNSSSSNMNITMVMGSSISTSVALTGASSGIVNNISTNAATSLTDVASKTAETSSLTSVLKPPETHTQQQFSWSCATSKSESVSHWVRSHHQRPAHDKHHERVFDTNLKRPSLPTKGSDSDSEQGVDSLYDFDALNMWWVDILYVWTPVMIAVTSVHFVISRVLCPWCS